MNLKTFSHLNILILVLSAWAHPVFSAENYPGYLGDGANRSSSPTNVGNNLDVKWIQYLDPQVVNTTYSPSTGFRGSIRSKNLSARDGEIALLVPYFAPNEARTDVGFLDAQNGLIKRRFATGLTTTTKAEWNSTGTEGRDLRNGQFRLNWHTNGNVYFRSSGDTMQQTTVRASDGIILNPIGELSANAHGYIGMCDNSIWAMNPKQGHWMGGLGFRMYDLAGNVSGVAHSTVAHFFNAASFLMDGDWVYVLGPVTNSAISNGGFTTSTGARVNGFNVKGQTATAGNVGLVTPPSWTNWSDASAYICKDSDGGAAIKPWCLGKNDIFLLTHNGSPDLNAPVLNVINRTTGAEKFRLNLAFTDPQVYFHQSKIAYADRTSTDGKEYVAIMLPGVKIINNDYLTSIAVVDAVTQTKLWEFQYPISATPTYYSNNCNSNPSIYIAGNTLYVAYAKGTGLTGYVSSSLMVDMILHVDAFSLADGTRTLNQDYPLGVQGNSNQLDHLIAMDGMLYALVTTFEWNTTQAGHIGGAQLLVALGSTNSANQAPAFTQDPSASPSSITHPVNSTQLSATASDPDGPTVSYFWNKVSGDGDVTFSGNGTSNDSTVTASFAKAATYVLSCRASDGDKSVTKTVTVTVNPSPVQINAGTTVNCTENIPASGSVAVTRSGGTTAQDLVVTYTLKNVTTAQIGSDFQTPPGYNVTSGVGTFTIPAGSASTTLLITPIDDALIEGNEKVRLILLEDPNFQYKLGTGNNKDVTITDDDANKAPILTFQSSIVFEMDGPSTTRDIYFKIADDNFQVPTGTFVINVTKTSGPGTPTFTTQSFAATNRLPGESFWVGRISFTASTLLEGTYGYQVSVGDGALVSSLHDLTIQVNNTGSSPTASLILNKSWGTAPLTFQMDGSGSSDPDGSISRFNFLVGTTTVFSGYGFDSPSLLSKSHQIAIGNATPYAIKLEVFDSSNKLTSMSQNIRVDVDSDFDLLGDDWENAHFGSLSAPTGNGFDDPDGDSSSNYNEYISGTNPNDSKECFAVTSQASDVNTNYTLTWPSIAGKLYEVQFSTTLSSWTSAGTVVGTSPSTSWTDDGTKTGTPPNSATQRFYRIRTR